MSREEVRSELLKFIKTNLVDEKLELTTETDLQDTAGLDSMALVEIILFIERKFDVTFSDEELNPQIFQSVDVLTDAVLNHS